MGLRCISDCQYFPSESKLEFDMVYLVIEL